MESYRLKNIILIILVLLNVFLLSVLGMRRIDQREREVEAEAQIVQLLASHGIRLEADEILTRGDAAETIYQVAKLKYTAPGILAIRAAQ